MYRKRRKVLFGSQSLRRTLAFELFESRLMLTIDFQRLNDISAVLDPPYVNVSTSYDPNGHRIIEIDQTVFFIGGRDESYGLWKSDGTALGTTQVKGWSSDRPFHPLKLWTEVNGALFFIGGGDGGSELWKSDGTEAGTVRVKDIWPGPASSFLGAGSIRHPGFVNVGGTLFFTASDGISGYELWKSDGTEAGTMLVKDIRPGLAGSSPSNMINVDGILYFQAYDGSNAALWKSDGTEEGTVPIKNVVALPDRRELGYFENVSGTLYFVASDDVTGFELWKSDGTEAGTVLVKDINGGGIGSFGRRLTNVDGILYFIANDGVSGHELWKSDGTEAGTIQVKDIRVGAESSFRVSSSNPVNDLINIAGILYFTANDGASGSELWRSDGTAEGTMLVSDVLPGEGSSEPLHLTEVSGSLYFSAQGGSAGRSLWVYGSIEGVRLVNNPQGSPVNPGLLTNVGGVLYFSAYDDEIGYFLWKSDGATGGTRRVHDIFWSAPTSLVSDGESVYFVVDDEVSGYELWRTNESGRGAIRVKDIRSGAGNSRPQLLTNVNGEIFFVANDGEAGYELWKSDGTGAGTFIVKDINAGLNSSAIGELSGIDSTLFFTCYGGPGGWGLWQSDGTDAGTVRIKDFGAASVAPSQLTNVDGMLFFVATDGVGALGLWKSDGTEAGTVRISDVLAEQLTNVGGKLFFVGNDGISGKELWKSDGNETIRVRDVWPGGDSSQPFNLTNVGGVIYFTANDGVSGYELWKSNGTEGSTVRVKDIHPGNAAAFSGFASQSDYLTNVGGTLFFVANDGVSGSELWKSDGTESGTTRVKDIYAAPSIFPSSPRNLVNIGGILYFGAADASAGFELWTSDGSEAGTKLVKDFINGEGSGYPRFLTKSGSRLFVVASSDEINDEIWYADLAPSQMGDFDLNDAVDGADFLLWQRGFGGTVTSLGSGADGDGSGIVDNGDLGVWIEHFGEPGAGGGELAAAPMVVAALGAAEEVGEEIVAAGVSRDAQRSERRSAAVDAIYAAGDFASLFAEVRSHGVRERRAGWRRR